MFWADYGVLRVFVLIEAVFEEKAMRYNLFTKLKI
jgi:hypothetical protein